MSRTNFTNTAAQALRSLAPLARIAAKAFRNFSDAYYKTAENEYRRVKGKLPGSTKTARMRKKRRSEVLSWFNRQLILKALEE